jgi:hypothetical protein
MVRDEVLGRSDCTALIDPALWAKRTSHDYLSFGGREAFGRSTFATETHHLSTSCHCSEYYGS